MVCIQFRDTTIARLVFSTYSNPDKLVWGAQTGCLTNQDSLAFSVYAKNCLKTDLLCLH